MIQPTRVAFDPTEARAGKLCVFVAGGKRRLGRVLNDDEAAAVCWCFDESLFLNKDFVEELGSCAIYTPYCDETLLLGAIEDFDLSSLTAVKWPEEN